jgi:predicted ATPase
VGRIKTLPALLIVTFRPEFNAPWLGQSRVTSLTLTRLGEVEAAAIIARLAGNRALPADVMAEIVERTDGIPLFVEEMTKSVLEAESEGEARRTAAAVPSPALAVPASLHASLMARLDRLGPAKEVAQIGAAIGREVSHALLAAVVRQPEADLASALDRLIAAGLLFRQGVPPHVTYLFKHALVQDAAYGTLLREPRRALHARIAESLESQFAEVTESRPEILARHSTEAGLVEKAAGLWGKAGQRSLARSALIEGVAQLGKALGQIATLPITPMLRREEIKLQVALASALIHVKGYTSPETIAAFERADALIEQAEALGEHPEGSGGKAGAICTVAGSPPTHGRDSSYFGRVSDCPVAPRSSDYPLCPRGTQVARDQIWSGYRRCVIGLPVIRPVPPRLPRTRARGCANFSGLAAPSSVRCCARSVRCVP